jgi:RNA polymerase sigma-70 factor (ECF subfamily)
MPAADEPFDLASCLRQARAKEPDACRQLVGRMYPLVARIVNAYLPRGVSAEDWHQEAFLRMFLRLDQYRADAPFEHWLARLTVNVCLDQLRRHRRRELRWSDLDEKEAAVLHASLTSPSTAAEALAARELVNKLMLGLAAEDHVVLRMLDLEGRSVAEVAQLLDQGESWVKVRAFRARQQLRDMLDRLHKERSDG